MSPRHLGKEITEEGKNDSAMHKQFHLTQYHTHWETCECLLDIMTQDFAHHIGFFLKEQSGSEGVCKSLPSTFHGKQNACTSHLYKWSQRIPFTHILKNSYKPSLTLTFFFIKYSALITTYDSV